MIFPSEKSWLESYLALGGIRQYIVSLESKFPGLLEGCKGQEPVTKIPRHGI